MNKIPWNHYDRQLIEQMDANLTFLQNHFDKIHQSVKDGTYVDIPMDERLKDGLRFDVKEFLIWFADNFDSIYPFVKLIMDTDEYLPFENYVKIGIMAFIKHTYRFDLPVDLTEYKELVFNISKIDDIYDKCKDNLMKIFNKASTGNIKDILIARELFTQFDFSYN